MNIEKIQINGHYVWVDKDAEIKEGEWFYNPFQGIVSVDSNSDGCIKIIAASPKLNLEGVPTYVEWLAERETISNEFNSEKSFIKGYQTAEKELPTWDDVRKAIELVRPVGFPQSLWDKTTEEVIEQLKQSKNQ